MCKKITCSSVHASAIVSSIPDKLKTENSYKPIFNICTVDIGRCIYCFAIKTTVLFMTIDARRMYNVCNALVCEMMDQSSKFDTL